MKNHDDMYNIPESIAKQPIDKDTDINYWKEKALPLVRKIFNEIKKPNGVLFKNDSGQLIICLRKDDKFDWNNVLALKMGEMKDKYDDISADPFEFVFCNVEEDKFTTLKTKTTIPNYTMTKLYNEGKLEKVVEKDYENQFGGSSVRSDGDGCL